MRKPECGMRVWAAFGFDWRRLHSFTRSFSQPECLAKAKGIQNRMRRNTWPQGVYILPVCYGRKSMKFTSQQSLTAGLPLPLMSCVILGNLPTLLSLSVIACKMGTILPNFTEDALRKWCSGNCCESPKLHTRVQDSYTCASNTQEEGTQWAVKEQKRSQWKSDTGVESLVGLF